MISRRKYLATILGERERLVFGVTMAKPPLELYRRAILNINLT